MLPDDFPEVVGEDFPLAGAGVLELVEEPVLHVAVEAVIDVELALGVQQQGDVVTEGQPAALADFPVVDGLVTTEEAMHGLGLREFLFYRESVGLAR